MTFLDTLVNADHKLDDLYEQDMFLTSRLSPYAKTRYDSALWYVWGRQDAGDAKTCDKRSGHYLGDDFAFAIYAAAEAERYHRKQRTSLSCISTQYAEFLAALP